MRISVTTTNHAAGQIKSRTNSTQDEFSKLCSEKLYLVLGKATYKHQLYTYVLLYLQKEDRHYIAVLNGKQTVITSIWKSDYKLPRKLPKLRRCHRRKVRCMVTDALQFRR